jgi:hypothetical protein
MRVPPTPSVLAARPRLKQTLTQKLEGSTMSVSHTDFNLLFAVIALQLDMIEQSQFAEACALWGMRMERPMADLLEERNWISPEDRHEISRNLERKLRKHAGDARASLAAAAGASVREVLRSIEEPLVRQTIEELLPVTDHALRELDFASETPSRDRALRAQQSSRREPEASPISAIPAQSLRYPRCRREGPQRLSPRSGSPARAELARGWRSSLSHVSWRISARTKVAEAALAAARVVSLSRSSGRFSRESAF